MQELRLNLDRNIRGLIDFKVVLQTITDIQSMTISVEIKIKEIQETYNVLEEHQLKVRRGGSEGGKVVSSSVHMFILLIFWSHNTRKIEKSTRILGVVIIFPNIIIFLTCPLHFAWLTLQFPFADLLLAFDLERRWQKLYKSALHRNRSLQIVKSKFAEMTSKEVAAFNAKVCVKFNALLRVPAKTVRRRRTIGRH